MRSSMDAAENRGSHRLCFSGASRRIYGVAATPSDTVEQQRLQGFIFWRVAPVDTGKGDL
jgi:hypothetical protein